MTSSSETDQPIDQSTAEQISECNATGRTPVVFIHGLWLLPSSWDRWAELFEKNGYTALTPGWPDDPETTDEANAHPEVMAHKTVGQVADHYNAIIDQLDRKPALVGHSFGGMIAQKPRRARTSPRPPSRSTPHRSRASCRCRSRRCGRPCRSSRTRPTGTAPSR